jgi:hypothetical protein
MMAAPNPPQTSSAWRSPMKRIAVVLCLLGSAAVSAVAAQEGFKSIKEFLTGYEEVPAVSTSANAQFEARISKDGTEIAWELSYSALEGTITQSHIHVAQAGVNGGISTFLCSNLGNGPAGTQPCPPGPATISGTILATDIIGPAAQGVTAGELDELIAAMRAGVTYVNVHSTLWPGGEVRSQIDGNNSHNH